ncbi:unnamed protein product [Adineta steineri]|uniref:RRM domain-containing protein n=2 Tax=Adineta steineri TaxID=433720 RepID=A0A819LFA6_9BILA|nr:unnamed protein product [Adineta steineri]
MSKKTKKGKTTMPLTDFLGSGPKLVTVRESTWAAIVDEEEEKKKPIVVDMSGLPTAPRSAVDIDYSTLPNNPPFVAHVANLSFEIDDESLRRIFADLNPKVARIMREGNRSRGVGLVEFDTRENLIDALKRTDKEIYGRKIRINVSDKTDFHQSDSNRSNFGNRSNRTGEERPEMADRWKRVERRSDEASDDRSNMGHNRDRNNQGRSSYTSGSRDGQRGSDYGFGYPRGRDDRGGGGGRDHDRSGPRRYNNNNNDDDNNRQSGGMDRPRYGGRYSDTHDTRERIPSTDDAREPPKERPRLQLQPRTKPLQELQPLSGSSSSVDNVAATSSLSNTENSPSMNDSNPDEYQQQGSHEPSEAGSSIEQSTVKPLAPSRGAGASIFGGAKPVDTAAKELEIERKLKELQLANSETGEEHTEKVSTSRSSYNHGHDRDTYHGKRSSYNDEHRNRDRRDDGIISYFFDNINLISKHLDRSGHGSDYHHKREYSGGRRYEDDSRRSHNDDQQRRDRDRYTNPSRRDHDTGGRTGKYNHHNQSDRDNYRPRDRDTNEHNTQRRSSDDNFNSEPQSKTQPRGLIRRTVPTNDDSNRLQLSNKFGMLNDIDLDDNDDVQSPTTDD